MTESETATSTIDEENALQWSLENPRCIHSDFAQFAARRWCVFGALRGDAILLMRQHQLPVAVRQMHAREETSRRDFAIGHIGKSRTQPCARAGQTCRRDGITAGDAIVC